MGFWEAIFYLVLIILVFLASREIVLWYAGITRIVERLDKVIIELKNLNTPKN